MKDINYNQMKLIQNSLLEVLKDMNFNKEWLSVLKEQFESDFALCDNLISLSTFVSWSMLNFGIHVGNVDFANSTAFQAVVIVANEMLAIEN